MDTKILHPKALQTRLIYPFFFKPKSVCEAVSALTGLKQEGRKGEIAVWESTSEVPELYHQEMFSSAQRFLFADENISDCRYLRLNDNRANAWFRNKIHISVPRNNIDDFTVTLLPKTGVELFLSPFGVGILSLAFEVNLPDVDTVDNIESYKLYNYYLSQMRKGTEPSLSLPTAPAHLTQPESDNNTIGERLGKAGESFRLKELCDYLLQGLEGDLGLNLVQKQFSVYTAAQFSNAIDFSLPDLRKDLGPFLSGLAQVEEVSHAGHIPSENLDIVNHVMNTRHWAAMSFLGVAHLVADQGVEFDNQRLHIVAHKYFAPYLATYFQRLILQRLLNDASQFLHTEMSSEEQAQQFSYLHSQLLDFNVTGLFTEISSREALNRYYYMGQSTFAIDKNMSRVSSAIQNYDTNKITKGLTDNVTQISKIQGSVEWFQVLFVIGATTQLTEYIGDLAGKDTLYAKYSMLLAPILTGLVALIALRPWDNDPDFKKNKVSIISFGIFLGLAFLIWWGGAFWQGKDNGEDLENTNGIEAIISEKVPAKPASIKTE
ncbi:MAG: hypothetical protein ACW7DR_11420 [Paraglaciecola chathamensis]